MPDYSPTATAEIEYGVKFSYVLIVVFEDFNHTSGSQVATLKEPSDVWGPSDKMQ